MKTAADSRPSSPLEQGFGLGPLRVDPSGGEVAGPGGREQLDPKVMGVLLMLAERAGRVVPREDIQARLWPNVVVTEDALSRCLHDLRRQLASAGGSDDCRAMVETLPKRGYRLKVPVTPLPAAREAGGIRRRPVTWVAAAAATAALAFAGYRLAFAPGADAPAATDARHAIAVLPFVDMSAGQDQGYFSDGTAEEILNRLAQSPDLRVIARTSSFTFRDQPLEIPEIARRLEVTHVLEGSVRKSGDRVRVTAQLIAAADGAHLWSETYDRTLGDVFAIQDDIAASVAAALETTLAQRAQAPRPPSRYEAYELVLRGEQLYWRRSPGDLQQATLYFEEAVELDPGFARAWADLAGAYSFLAWAVDPPDTVLRTRQGEAARRAVQLQPGLALAQRRLAQYFWESGDERSARKHMRLARELDPDDPVILGDRATEALDKGDIDGALHFQRRALQRDPLNWVARHNLGVVLITAGRLEEALAHYRTSLEIQPDMTADQRIEIPRLLAMLGRYDEAAAAARPLEPAKFRNQAIALLAPSAGHRAEADAALRALESYVPVPPMDTPEHAIMDSIRLAEAYAQRGRTGDAFATLERRGAALRQHPDWSVYGWYLRHEARLAPFLEPLHADPRWAAFLDERASINRGPASSARSGA